MPSRGMRVRLDRGAMIKALWQPLAVWSAAVLAVSLIGQPLVVCITPLAWLLAIPVGQRVIDQSKNQFDDRSLIEAALCGGILGLIQGLLFLPVGYITPGMTRQDRQLLLVLSLFSIMIGLFVCAALAFFFAMLRQDHLDDR